MDINKFIEENLIRTKMNTDENNLRDIALEFLKSKCIHNPEDFWDKICCKKETLDRLTRLLLGDIVADTTNFSLEFKKFAESVPSWRFGVISLERLANRMMSSTNESNKKQKVMNSSSDELIEGKLFWSQLEEMELDPNFRINEALVIRKQNSGYCYLHAPVVLEHYLVIIATQGKALDMINIGKYEAQFLDGDKIQEFIMNPLGGNARTFLQDLCTLYNKDLIMTTLPDPIDSPEIFKRVCEDILIKVADKPFLVSGFEIHSNFLVQEKFSFIMDDVVEERCIGTHSMLLIGVRKNELGKYYFLLQNWWESKFFIEVSSEYFQYCNGSLTWVNKVITQHAKDLPLYVASYAETCLDGEGEAFFDKFINIVVA